MPDIVLSTLNARYAHAAFGLRYLMANLGELRERAAMLEFDVSTRPLDVVEAIAAQRPRVVGLGVYIWNAAESPRVVEALRRVLPDAIIVLGGPEVSHEIDQQEICRLADYVIPGEGDIAFADLCRKLLSDQRPLTRIIRADLLTFAPDTGSQKPDTRTPKPETRTATSHTLAPTPQTLDPSPRPLELPYDLYTPADLAQRVVYVEASRGCPFRCEFCLSSLDVPLRSVPLDRFLPAMQALLDRGLRQFKFVDRTFNLNIAASLAILEFFLERYTPGLFLHFEMIPDRLPEALREPIARFPGGALQFEVGVQTFNEEVAERISQRQDNAKAEANLRWLRAHTSVHVHADLIAGLPGEDLASFAGGFDRLVALGPQEIQVGILKRLRGTPIVRHDAEWRMVYSPHAPYEILHNRLIDFPTMQRLRRFARCWDLIGNSGNFAQTTRVMIEGRSPFDVFWRLSQFIFDRAGRTHSIALNDLAGHAMDFAQAELRIAPARVAEAIWADYQRCGRSDRPAFLRPFITAAPAQPRAAAAARRQERHLPAKAQPGLTGAGDSG